MARWVDGWVKCSADYQTTSWPKYVNERAAAEMQLVAVDSYSSCWSYAKAVMVTETSSSAEPVIIGGMMHFTCVLQVVCVFCIAYMLSVACMLYIGCMHDAYTSPEWCGCAA